jgi:predicted transcriptional regulator
MSIRPVIKLTQQLQKAMAEQMAAGGYGSEEAMILDALRALADRRNSVIGIEAGLADMKAGRMRPWTQAKAKLDQEVSRPRRP